MARSVKPCKFSNSICGQILLSKSGWLFIYSKVFAFRINIRLAVNFVFVSILNLKHITYDLLLHFMTINPQVLISPDLIEKWLNLLVLIPVVKKPIQAFVNSLPVVAVEFVHLICPWEWCWSLLFLYKYRFIYEARLLFTTLQFFYKLKFTALCYKSQLVYEFFCEFYFILVSQNVYSFIFL